MAVEVCADPEAAARRGAELIAASVAEAVEARGDAAIAVSGGRAPWRMLEHLGELDVAWQRVSLFQVDERVAPDGDHERNLTHLLASLPAPAAASVRPMPVTDDDLDAAARRYGAALPAALDLVHLGLGPDGHTASLVPGDAVLQATDRPVALAGPYQGRHRMTLTYPTLAAARRILWLVTGSDKREALARLRAGDRAIPAARVAAARAALICDRAALDTV